jgi:hypothetical protein
MDDWRTVDTTLFDTEKTPKTLATKKSEETVPQDWLSSQADKIDRISTKRGIWKCVLVVQAVDKVDGELKKSRGENRSQ